MSAFPGEFSLDEKVLQAIELNFIFMNSISVAKALGYKVIRNNQTLNKASQFEFNYEMKFSLQNRKQEQDMWNICWTDSIVAVDFCREMRRFQKINVRSFEPWSWEDLMTNLFCSISRGCLKFAARISWRGTWIECWSFFLTTTTSSLRLGASRQSKQQLSVLIRYPTSHSSISALEMQFNTVASTKTRLSSSSLIRARRDVEFGSQKTWRKWKSTNEWFVKFTSTNRFWLITSSLICVFMRFWLQLIRWEFSCTTKDLRGMSVLLNDTKLF